MRRPSAEHSAMDRRQFLLAGSLGLTPFLGATGASRALADDVIAGNLRRLTDPGAGDNRATYLPDRRTLLFASKRSGTSQIWAVELAGGEPQLIHRSSANDFGRVTPNLDGTRLCFSSDRGGQNAVYVLERASGEVRPVSDPAYWSFGPTWSSRDLIAFFSRKGGNAINVWTVRPDGSQARQITDAPGESRQPWRSPDGRALAISADHGGGVFQVWLMDADGAKPRAITTRGSFAQPFWSPDGRSFAVSARTDGPFHRICVMDADGSNLRPIRQPDGVDNVHPAWSPDGRRIVFTSGRQRLGALWLFEFG
jgi:Tol biopolymer transport system component